MSRRISILLIVLTLLLAACQPVATPQATGPQTYTLGIALPYTGDLGSFGTDFKKGVELAVMQVGAIVGDGVIVIVFPVNLLLLRSRCACRAKN